MHDVCVCGAVFVDGEHTLLSAISVPSINTFG